MGKVAAHSLTSLSSGNGLGMQKYSLRKKMFVSELLNVDGIRDVFSQFWVALIV